MYYLVFGFAYLLSLLPFWILYRIADFAFFLIYAVVGYRKKIVMQNLSAAFPGKTDAELKKIRRDFYRNFCDNWVEMLKTLSISRKQIRKRLEADLSVLYELHKTGKSVQIFSGHFMNWEYANIVIAHQQPYTFLGIYMPLKNKIFDRLLKHLRSRFGTVLLKAGDIRREMVGWRDKQYLVGVIADQSPGSPVNALWMSFMNRPAGFLRNPWRKAIQLNQPVVYMVITRRKRGYYTFRVVELENEPSKFSEAQLALKYRDLLEQDIRNDPGNYLWTHRRWKLGWKEEYRDLWIDDHPPPNSGESSHHRVVSMNKQHSSNKNAMG